MTVHNNYGSLHNISFFRERFISRIRKDNYMTLIIGFKCKDGAVLISDRKVTDISSNKEKWTLKIHNPLPSVTLFYAASGYAHLFKQFNRRIPLIVNERLREYELRNYGIMKDFGVDYYETLNKIEEKEPIEIQSSDIEPAKSKKNIEESQRKLPKPVLLYGHEEFIQDCQKLIRELCKDNEGYIENKLEVLLILFDPDGSRLHQINYGGEDELNFSAIGSGSIFVNQILDQFYDENKELEYLIRLGIFCIFYVQRFIKDTSVGVEEGKLPDIQVILNDGRFGNYKFENEEQIIDEINKKVKKFTNLQDNLTF